MLPMDPNSHDAVEVLLIFFHCDIVQRGRTALMRAVEHRHEDIASLLLKAGAKPNVNDMVLPNDRFANTFLLGKEADSKRLGAGRRSVDGGCSEAGAE